VAYLRDSQPCGACSTEGGGVIKVGIGVRVLNEKLTRSNIA
jgi:hypothetical protein